MANLKEIRTRMNSVKTTRQVTSAMKMVSASKLRRAQEAIIRIRPYANKLSELLGNLNESLKNIEDNPYAAERGYAKILIVAINSNRGLCGAFNSNVNRRVFQMLKEDFQEQVQKNDVHIMAIGKNTFDFFRRRGLNVSNHNHLYEHLNFEHVAPVAEEIMTAFVGGTYDKVYLVFNEFKNAATQYLVVDQFLPILPKEEDKKVTPTDYIFEPTKEEIIKDLIPKSLKIQFYKALLDSNAAEHGARMTAMHKATDNATDLLRNLNLQYNKARQATITGEILEIVSGAEALKG
ncbi:MAG TPA: ATP synthase F1 subunit gamma [Marinilabiliales bacterium]|jgi:F-type H+-transporting ATPase subunit gamma|nr:MAG: ATP synthase F1 subunit gamma [Bacteroidetes bacterium GWA2_40_14]OFX56930.1 MAG: ATP synthase F1 subunit gamma [Bacteroidetes bacterium GWC2_40_13]OFX71663.1 MAG: ATP synthase F1 subunit gamma [Bacteroidetes bacterium GWD2_40_43]OFX90202.1 MAG: ATP synthase F1 subunit gamma [Bacteroidetes bacterium GWE2_40_63]OFY18652.1 MAG: ATP synthase F1 subunit gamma [Bacteroidetes bacterium GWF2_40_13]OFZ27665.1 MAG: ATP synthase F1 subunit gamma [Bacteroidetes bacterium RIFOXYC2_FULL_40_12]HAM9